MILVRVISILEQVGELMHGHGTEAFATFSGKLQTWNAYKIVIQHRCCTRALCYYDEFRSLCSNSDATLPYLRLDIILVV